MIVTFKEILQFVDLELGILAYEPYESSNSCCGIRFPEDRGSEGTTMSYYERIRLFDVHQEHLRYFEVSKISYFTGFWRLSMWTLVDCEAGLSSSEHGCY
ncbi:hypothetical protein ACH5RR_003682 [Cinchona calisaya]|uniref:Uncharacterized protein n=1 Tax=Cinchona calisaya TaxID=153742 RepID=A0ABD3AVV4_9GENT